MDYKQLIIDSGKEMKSKNLTVSTWGNISARDFNTGYIYITPSGMDYSTCTKEDILVFDKDADIIEGHRRPTIEKDMHIKIYQNRADAGAVLHTHPMYSTVFGVLGWDVPAITEEFAQVIGRIVRSAKYYLPGTIELAKSVVEALGQDSKAVLCINHGAVCVGADMEQAFAVSTILEKACQIYYMAKSIGEPIIITDEDVNAMQKFVATKYGQYEE